jgi:RimJ/RimL family protein N-acetyltransferase
MDQPLTTPRLILRPLRAGDGPRIQAFCGAWPVARMLARVPYPYPDGLAETWIAQQAADRQSGLAYVFAILLDDEVIGVIGLERRAHGAYELGYWLGEPWWGQGYMSEAAARVVRFAFDDLKLDRVTASYFADNPASGRVQEKCGFRTTGHGRLACTSRGAEVDAVFAEARP